MDNNAKKLASSALRDALMDDYDSARQRLKELGQDDLKAMQRACMALQNLAGARLYAMALRADEEQLVDPPRQDVG